MKTLVMSMMFLAPGAAEARSHSFYSQYQTGYDNHVIIQQSAESDFGPLTFMDGTTSYWRGYGVTTTLGGTYRDFVIGSLGYTMLDQKNNASDQHIWGNALDLSLKLSFGSPMGSLELGGGATAERLSASSRDVNSNVLGSGPFYSAGLNYMVSYAISVDADLKVSSLTYHSDSGASFLDGAKSQMYRPSLGLRVKF